MHHATFSAIARRAVAQHAAGGAKALNATCQINAQGELLLYGIIGDWWDGLDAKTIVQQLVAANATGPLTVRIHSDGGSIMDGLAIINAMKATGRETHAIVDGVAASMAAYIALSLDQLSMPENAWLMLHKSRIGGSGMTANDLRDSAEVLDQFDAMLAKIIATKTGKTQDDVLAMIDKDVWIDGATAVAEGYADTLLTPIKAAAQLSVANRATAPAALRTLMTVSQPPAPAATNQPKGETMKIEARAKAVGLTRRDNETDEAFLARIEAAEQAQAKAEADAKAKADAEAKAAADAKAAAAAKAKAAGLDPQAIADASAQAITAERNRIRDIRALCTTHGIDETTQASMIDNGTTVAEARSQVLDALAQRTGAQLPGGHVSVGNHLADMRPVIAEALLHRANPSAQLSDNAREFRGMSLVEIARAVLTQGGMNMRGKSAGEVARAALTTSDLPNIMGDVAHKVAMDVYNAQSQDWKKFCRREDFSDFRDVNHVELGADAELKEVDETGEFTHGSLRDSGEKTRAKTYGRKLMLSRQLIVNDDLNVFFKLARIIGFKAVSKENNLAWGILTGNPKMSDNKTLFHADHKNLGTPAAIGETALSEMRKLLRKQKDASGDNLGLIGKYLILPTSLQTAGQKMIAAITPRNSDDVNVFSGQLELIVSDHLDDASETSFYLAPDPSFISSIVWGYLAGSQGLQLQQDIKFGEGVLYTGFLDFGVGPVDYRGLVKNAGK